jgi:hypothetical protein
MAERNDKLPTADAATRVAVDAFLDQVRRMPAVRTETGRGRLVFALDATASREPTWDRACRIQGEMFEATAGLGGLEIQLVFYRGFAECKASRWMSRAAELHGAMTAVRCAAGATQIERVLAQALKETKVHRIQGLVFVGDAMEENVDALAARAGELALLGVPAFMFHEGRDPVAARAFRTVAQITRGAYCPFDLASAETLRELLAAVAVYAAGGRKALEAHGARTGGAALLIAAQLGKPG